MIMKKNLKYIFPLLLLVLTSCGRDGTTTSDQNNVISSTSEVVLTTSDEGTTTEEQTSKEEMTTTEEQTSKEETTTSEQSVVANGYYQGINVNATGETLMNALHKKIKSFTSVSYDSLKEHFKKTDNKDGYFWDMYSNKKYPIDETIAKGNSYEGAGWNREHSVPKSWFGDKSPMYSDIYHLYPTDCYVNNQRSNYPFGEVSTASYTSTNNCKLGSNAGSGPSKVFEPADEYKGDFARTYFYFATCYMDKTINLKEGSAVFTGENSYPKLTQYSIDLFLKWDKNDPVSQKEIDRNNACYDIQKNRNPFIDYPNFAQQIWG